MGHLAGQNNRGYATGGEGHDPRPFREKGHEMPRNTKIEGKAIARILDAQTRETVGYLYEWNNGAVDPKWNDDIVRDEKDVVYEYE